MAARRTGQVINISSIGVLSNSPRFSAYVASKGISKDQEQASQEQLAFASLMQGIHW